VPARRRWRPPTSRWPSPAGSVGLRRAPEHRDQPLRAIVSAVNRAADRLTHRDGRPTLARLRRMTTRLAVIGGDGIGPEVVEVALQGPRRRASRRGAHRLRPGSPRVRPHGRGAARQRAGRAARATTRSCSARSATPSVPAGVLERGLLLRLRFALDHHVNLRPGAAAPGVVSPIGDQPWTWSSCARAPRAPTSATAGGCARGRRTRSPPRSASTPRTAWSGSCARRSGAREARERRHVTLVHKTNVLVHAGRASGGASSTRWPPSTRTSAPTTPTWTPPRCTSSPTRVASTSW
jgi:hypothetical protein